MSINLRKTIKLFILVAVITLVTKTTTYAAEYTVGAENSDYLKLQDAINSCKPKDTLKLRKDIFEEVIIPKNANIILNLNGCAISSTSKKDSGGAKAMVQNLGTLEIQDTSKNKKGLILSGTESKNDDAYSIYNEGTLKITRVSTISKGCSIFNQGGDIVIDNGIFIGGNTITSVAGKLTINNGVFNSQTENILKLISSVIEINGG